MPEQPNTSASDTPAVLPQQGFSPQGRENACLLKTRILNGEQVPLSELKAFILAAQSDLEGDRVKRNKAENKVDPNKEIDFF